MTVGEAIERACVLHPLEGETKSMYAWLSELEARVSDLLGSCEEKDLTSDDDGTELMAPKAYCELYPIYLMMKRELSVGDGERYGALADAFDRVYAELKAYACRTAALKSPHYIKTV